MLCRMKMRIAIGTRSGSTLYIAYATQIFANDYELICARWEYGHVKEAVNVSFNDLDNLVEMCHLNLDDVMLPYVYNRACENMIIKEGLPAGLCPLKIFDLL